MASGSFFDYLKRKMSPGTMQRPKDGGGIDGASIYGTAVKD